MNCRYVIQRVNSQMVFDGINLTVSSGSEEKQCYWDNKESSGGDVHLILPSPYFTFSHSISRR